MVGERRVRVDRGPGRRTASTTTSSIGTSCRGCCRGRSTTSSRANEAPVRRRARPARGPRLGEWLRRAVDLEHWAAFRRLVRSARQAVRPGRVAARTARPAPATICVLSGDVHHTYVSEAAYPRPDAVPRLPAHLLAHAQHHPARDAPRVQGRVEPVRVSPDAVPRPVRAARRPRPSTGRRRPGRTSSTTSGRCASTAGPWTSCSRSPISRAPSSWPSPRPTPHGT